MRNAEIQVQACTITIFKSTAPTTFTQWFSGWYLWSWALDLLRLGFCETQGWRGKSHHLVVLQSPHCPLHDAIPAFKIFPTSRKGALPSNTILARGSASELASGSHVPLAQSRGTTINVHISDTTLGMIFLTWLWCLVWFGASVEKMLKVKHGHIHIGCNGTTPKPPV